jgi:hypothetical protein
MKEPSFQIPLRERLHSRAFYLSLKVFGKEAPSPHHVYPMEPPTERDAHFESSILYSSLPREIKGLILGPQNLASVPSYVPELPVNQRSPWMSGGAFEPRIQSLLDRKIVT